MAITTSGFQLSALPQPLQVPGNLGVLKPPLDSQEILALAQQHLSALNQARQASVQQEQLGMERQRLASETAARQSALASEAQQRQQRGQLFPSQLQTAQQTAQRGALELPVYQSKAALDLAKNRFELGGVGPQETVSTFSQTPRGTYVQEEVNRVGNNVLSRKSVETPFSPGTTASDRILGALSPEDAARAARIKAGVEARPKSNKIAFQPDTNGVVRAWVLDESGGIIRQATLEEQRDAQTGDGAQAAPRFGGQSYADREAARNDAKLQAQIKAARPRVLRRIKQLEDQTGDIEEIIDEIVTLLNPYTTSGMGGRILSNLPGTEANYIQGLIDTVKTNVGIDRLLDIRDSSPSGAGLGNVSDTENKNLASSVRPLEIGLTVEQMLKSLKNVKRQRRNSLQRVKEYFDDEFGVDDSGAPQSAQSIPTLSPEMRALLEKTLAENPNSPDAPTARAMLGKQ